MKRRNLLTALFLLLAVCALALGIAAVRRAQRMPSSAGVRVPVLMYHAVGDDCWGEESLFVKPEELEKQLQYLSENGYETIFFEDLSHIEQYEKPVLLTFDDGYDDNAETLLPSAPAGPAGSTGTWASENSQPFGSAEGQRKQGHSGADAPKHGYL